MFAIAELSELTLAVPFSERGAVARQVAQCYLDCVSDVWRYGETERTASFYQRLSRFRTQEMPPYPACVADAVSPHGGGGRGIHWFETPEAVVGHIAGVAEGYVVPRQRIVELIAPNRLVDAEIRPSVTRKQGPLPVLADGAVAAVR